MNPCQGTPPLPGPLLPLREEREKILGALLPRAALAVLACPGLLSRCPFGAPEFRCSKRENYFRRLLSPVISARVLRGAVPARTGCLRRSLIPRRPGHP